MSRLVPRLPSVTPVELYEVSEEGIERIGEENRQKEEVGLLEFIMHYGALEYGDEDPARALDSFTAWPPNRARICFDVSDLNFCDLFSESPREVTERCSRLRDRLSESDILTYGPGEGAAAELLVKCEGSRWVVYSGFEDFDYILPSGEVTCLPGSVDGVLDVGGWIVGTMPFGLKYGRIEQGDLKLQFERRRVVRIDGRNRRLCADLEAALSRMPGLQMVSEAGVGQSKAVTKAAASHRVGYHWHERHFGLHLGLGAELTETQEEDVERATGHHLDIVLASGCLRDSGPAEVLRW